MNLCSSYKVIEELGKRGVNVPTEEKTFSGCQ